MLRKITVREGCRVLVIKNGKPTGILLPGRHVVFVSPFSALETETHQTSRFVFASRWTKYLMRERPDLVGRYFETVKTGNSEIAMVSIDGALFQVLLPGQRLLLWKDVATIAVERITIVDGPALPGGMLAELEHRTGAEAPVLVCDTDSDLSSEPVRDPITRF